MRTVQFNNLGIDNCTKNIANREETHLVIYTIPPLI